MHREHFLKDTTQKSLFEETETKPAYFCRSSESKKPIEWQADFFSACLLMPRQMVYAAWETFRDGDDGPVAIADLRERYSDIEKIEPFYHRGRIATDRKSKDLALQEEFCRPLAERFSVSPEAMRIRLEELKLLVTEKPRTLF